MGAIGNVVALGTFDGALSVLIQFTTVRYARHQTGLYPMPLDGAKLLNDVVSCKKCGIHIVGAPAGTQGHGIVCHDSSRERTGTVQFYSPSWVMASKCSPPSSDLPVGCNLRASSALPSSTMSGTRVVPHLSAHLSAILTCSIDPTRRPERASRGRIGAVVPVSCRGLRSANQSRPE